MNVNALLKELIKESNWNQTRLSKAFGYPSLQTFARRLLDSSVPKIDFVAAVLNKIGYDLVIVPSHSNLPAGSIVIESDFQYEEKPGRSRIKKEEQDD